MFLFSLLGDQQPIRRIMLRERKWVDPGPAHPIQRHVEDRIEAGCGLVTFLGGLGRRCVDKLEVGTRMLFRA